MLGCLLYMYSEVFLIFKFFLFKGDSNVINQLPVPRNAMIGMDLKRRYL